MRLGLLLELPTQRENVELARRAEAGRLRLRLGARVPQPLGRARAGGGGARDRADRARHRDRLGVRPLAAADRRHRARPGRDVGRAVRARPRHRDATDANATGWARPASARRTRLRETIEAVRAVWESSQAGAVRYDGELVQLDVRPYGRADQVRDEHPGLRGGGERGDGPHRRGRRRRRRRAPDGDAALHRRGDAAGDRRGRAARRSRRAEASRWRTG